MKHLKVPWWKHRWTTSNYENSDFMRKTPRWLNDKSSCVSPTPSVHSPINWEIVYKTFGADDEKRDLCSHLPLPLLFTPSVSLVKSQLSSQDVTPLLGKCHSHHWCVTLPGKCSPLLWHVTPPPSDLSTPASAQRRGWHGLSGQISSYFAAFEKVRSSFWAWFRLDETFALPPPMVATPNHQPSKDQSKPPWKLQPPPWNVPPTDMPPPPNRSVWRWRQRSTLTFGAKSLVIAFQRNLQSQLSKKKTHTHTHTTPYIATFVETSRNLARILRPNPHRTWDATGNATQANRTCWCEWGCTARKQHQKKNVRICACVASCVDWA